MLHYEHCYSEKNNALLAQHQPFIQGIIPQVVQKFYNFLLDNEKAREFIDEGVVKERLYQSQKNWLKQVLTPHRPEDKTAFLEQQKQVGRIHARIDLPLSLMEAATWVYKKAFFKTLILKPLQEASSDFPFTCQEIQTRSELFILISEIIEYGTSVINSAYHQQETELIKERQSLALNYASGDLAYEIVEVKSDATEWLLELILKLNQGEKLQQGQLCNANFYLWITHRLPMIEENPHRNTILTISEQLYQYFQQHLEQTTHDNPALITDLNRLIKQLSFALKSLSENLLKENDNRDPLTRLFNRRLLEAVLSKEHQLARKKQTSYALLMTDIDHFKEVNDTYGHNVGDIVLKEVARRLQEPLRITDLAFRFGGEEFLVVLPNDDEDALSTIGEKIRCAIADTPVEISDNQQLNITISVGIARYDHHPDYLHTLKEADAALYQAKNNGRNQVVIYQGDIL